MSLRMLLLAWSIALAPALLASQSQTSGGLDPATLLEPLADDWPTYRGTTPAGVTAHLRRWTGRP